MDSQELQFLEQCGIRPLEKIAHGACGEVWKVFSFNYQFHFALKIIPSSKFDDSEIECMKAIQSIYVVNLYNYYQFNEKIYLLMEFCENDLEKYIAHNKMLSHQSKINIINSCILSLKACHEHSIAHLDIKPSNYLFDQYGRIKLGDFGLASKRTNETLCDNFRGTKFFLAPELFKKQDFDPFKADIWALGVTIYYIATGTYPFMANDPRTLYERIISGVYSVQEVHDSGIVALLRRCLDVNPITRATIQELAESPLFTNDLQANKPRLLRSSHSQNKSLLLSDKIRKPRLTLRRSSFLSMPPVNQNENNNSFKDGFHTSRK